MAGKRRVTLRAQWLGQMLRELRERNEFTLKEAAEYLQKDFSTLSKFEVGTFPIRRGDLFALMALYGVDDKWQREVLLQLCGDVWQTGWWEKYSEDDVWGSTIDLVWLESRAHLLSSFAALSIPGLLQTRDYARALMRTVNSEVGESQIESWVKLRMERQRILHNEQPPRMSVVIDEAALRRQVGGPEVMAEQLRALGVAAARPHTDIRVVTFSSGAHPSPEGAFTLLTLEEPFSTVAHIESPAGAMYLERDDVDRLVRLYDRLQEGCLNVEESITFLADLEGNLS